jgi:hypothetical protein
MKKLPRWMRPTRVIVTRSRAARGVPDPFPGLREFGVAASWIATLTTAECRCDDPIQCFGSRVEQCLRRCDEFLAEARRRYAAGDEQVLPLSMRQRLADGRSAVATMVRGKVQGSIDGTLVYVWEGGMELWPHGPEVGLGSRPVPAAEG